MRWDEARITIRDGREPRNAPGVPSGPCSLNGDFLGWPAAVRRSPSPAPCPTELRPHPETPALHAHLHKARAPVAVTGRAKLLPVTDALVSNRATLLPTTPTNEQAPKRTRPGGMTDAHPTAPEEGTATPWSMQPGGPNSLHSNPGFTGITGGQPMPGDSDGPQAVPSPLRETFHRACRALSGHRSLSNCPCGSNGVLRYRRVGERAFPPSIKHRGLDDKARRQPPAACTSVSHSRSPRAWAAQSPSSWKKSSSDYS